MAKVDKLHAHLDSWMADTCNRYFHVLDDLGLIERTKARQMNQEMLDKRNAMLDQFVPLFVQATDKLLDREGKEGQGEDDEEAI